MADGITTDEPRSASGCHDPLHGARVPTPPISPDPSTGTEPPSAGRVQAVGQGLRRFYEKNFGLVLVFTAQTFGSIMSTAAKLLSSDESSPSGIRFHALHIIFIRMLVTTVLGSLYMWYKRVPDAPLGPRGVRRLLLLRGTAGFGGLFGLYYSLSYLEISDATAITFLVSPWAAIVAYVWLREPYRPKEAAAGLLAFVGVLCIARPAFLFPSKASEPIVGGNSVAAQSRAPASPAERAIAVIFGILGTLAAAFAYSTIRLIGTRAHSLISVNYFAIMATAGSTVGILVHPDLHFVLPQGALQWGLIAIIGFTGFLLQFLLTEGLQREKAGRATNMIYFQMVFALIIERVIWGTTPPVLSLVGSALIIVASLWLSLQSKAPEKEKTEVVDEESSLLGPGGPRGIDRE
ncbi:DUF6-domain-containing protein [Xylariaceae sp. FL0804]|nr:DUF6-domain-containing protein [Xylariaceae sp. FL0804]